MKRGACVVVCLGCVVSHAIGCAPQPVNKQIHKINILLSNSYKVLSINLSYNFPGTSQKVVKLII